MFAEAQAPDGMPVRESYSTVEGAVQDLPSPGELVSRARELSSRVSATRAAPVGEEFTGPVLLEGTGSSAFVAETLVPLMAAQRMPDSDNARMAQGFGASTPFLSRTGLRVMADSFSASDTPSLKQFDGRPVPGAYTVDDEGVRARDVTLVDKGRLVTLLSGPHAAEEFSPVQRPCARGWGVGRRVSARERPGDSSIGAESEIPGAAARAGQDVRLHRPWRRDRPGREPAPGPASIRS